MIPEFLKTRLINAYGNETTNQIISGYIEERVTSLRINTLKSSKEDILNELKQNNISSTDVSWYDNALIVNNKKEELFNLDIYKNGNIYLQSLSSQLPVLFLEPKENEAILDMAAAPGGKTTQIACLSNNKAMITAVEKNKLRSERLKYNLEKQGAKKVSVINVDARKLDEYFMFDKILLDAPCSGSGTLNLNNIDNNFNEDLINRSTFLQKELINKAIKHLKVNGQLIYSTCSILKDENEDIINYCLSSNKNIEIVPLDLSKFQELPLLNTKIEGTICLMPNKLYEGFFICKLRKKAD